ncbi:MAG: hypothetical protein SF029_08150 [bacterium]|nr:hypothetical protein [bacterium]
MLRYVRAFFTALGMTLRGERVPPSPFAPLMMWMDTTAKLTHAVYTAAEQDGLDKAARDKLRLKVDGRDMSMQTMLAGVEHHVRQEYPYMLKNLTEHSLTGIYASNMNDQYRLMRLRDADFLEDKAAAREAVARLSEHLNAIPPSNSLEG